MQSDECRMQNEERIRNQLFIKCDFVLRYAFIILHLFPSRGDLRLQPQHIAFLHTNIGKTLGV